MRPFPGYDNCPETLHDDEIEDTDVAQVEVKLTLNPVLLAEAELGRRTAEAMDKIASIKGMETRGNELAADTLLNLINIRHAESDLRELQELGDRAYAKLLAARTHAEG